MNPSGSHHHAPAAGYQHHIQQRASLSAAKHHAPQPDAAKSQSQLVGDGAPPRDATTLIASPTYRDVLNGRGQGVQRHPGNVKYRALVYVNKGLYAKCPRNDKIKISKGIVAAVREVGGRFLEMDDRTSLYYDIGDKKATEKTSQALREGQTQIRKNIYRDETAGLQSYDMSLISNLSSTASGAPIQREISELGYFGYSVQVLEAFYSADENAAQSSAPNVPVVHSLTPTPNVAASSPAAYSNNSAAMAMALDQFPGAVPAPQVRPTQQNQVAPLFLAAQPQIDTPLALMGHHYTNPSVRFSESGVAGGGGGRPSVGRLTNVSLASMISINSLRQLLESARNESYHPTPDWDGTRGSISSALSTEIRDLIRFTEPQLIQVETMAMDDIIEGYKDVMFAENYMKDRVSELRFTDTSRDYGSRVGGDHNLRYTDSTESTIYSRTSLMDASMMTINAEEMSHYSGPDGKRYHIPSSQQQNQQRQRSSVNDSGDIASAELLLGLSTDHYGANRHS